jgi:hypothetical protein
VEQILFSWLSSSLPNTWQSAYVDISSTTHEHNLQTQVQLVKPSLLVENHRFQVHTPFVPSNQEIPMD